jgi:glutathione S-transferase
MPTITTTYKLYYFPIRGLAEVIRLMFAQANVPFVDERVPFDEFVAKYKFGLHKFFINMNIEIFSDFPFEKMPVLEIDGNTKLAQTLVICEYLAKEFGNVLLNIPI